MTEVSSNSAVTSGSYFNALPGGSANTYASYIQALEQVVDQQLIPLKNSATGEVKKQADALISLCDKATSILQAADLHGGNLTTGQTNELQNIENALNNYISNPADNTIEDAASTISYQIGVVLGEE